MPQEKCKTKFVVQILGHTSQTELLSMQDVLISQVRYQQ